MNPKFMSKQLLVLFQKSPKLSSTVTAYQAILDELFVFFVRNDHVDDDVTSETFLPRKVLTGVKKGIIVAKSPCVVAGVEEIVYLAKKHTKLTPKTYAKDGEHIASSKKILSLKGTAKEILSYERVFLNLLQRMSGIATETARFVAAVRSSKIRPLIAATRKTPWMHVDKKAVAVGGGVTHRLDLQDGILVKDNHLAVIAQQLSLRGRAVSEDVAISYAIEHADIVDKDVAIEVEVKTDAAAFSAIASYQKRKLSNPFIILLDNFTPKRAKSVISSFDEKSNGISHSVRDDKRNIFFEASGGITIENIKEWAATDVDIISIGALTHSPKAADMSLDIS